MLARRIVRRTKVLSTKVSPRDAQYLTIMVERYFEKGIIKQAKPSTLLRLIVRNFLRKRCPEYERGRNLSRITYWQIKSRLQELRVLT